MTKYLTILLVLGGIVLIFIMNSDHRQPSTPSTAERASHEATPAAQEPMFVGPDEASCPVTGEVKKKAAMIPITIKGKTYYLCCEACRPKLLADPMKYINNMTAATGQEASSQAQGPIAVGIDEAVCPVTGEVKKKNTMIPIKVSGKTYYLCCEECRPKLLADPEKYIKTTAATNRESTSQAPKPVIVGADEASCPVMGMVNKKASMVPVKVNGKTYYLCCEDCRPKFLANPTGYINNPAPPSEKMCD